MTAPPAPPERPGLTGAYLTRALRDLPYAAALALARTVGLHDETFDAVRRAVALIIGRGSSRWAVLRWDGGRSRIVPMDPPPEIPA